MSFPKAQQSTTRTDENMYHTWSTGTIGEICKNYGFTGGDEIYVSLVLTSIISIKIYRVRAPKAVAISRKNS